MHSWLRKVLGRKLPNFMRQLNGIDIVSGIDGKHPLDKTSLYYCINKEEGKGSEFISHL